MPDAQLSSEPSANGASATSPQSPEGLDLPVHTEVPSTNSPSYHSLPIVALGGSAGSIADLMKFFTAIPADTGFAFVVVLHLSPEHESILAELLQRNTLMPSVQVNATTKLLPNHVYVIPPGKHLSMSDGHLHVVPPVAHKGRRLAVDLFFRTLADTHGPNAIAVVLSGADGDGAIGIKRIKERGGLTIAQDPNEAEHVEMPRSAINTGMVDWVLPVSEMPARIVEYRRRAGRVKLPMESGPDLGLQEEAPNEKAQEAVIRDLLAFVKVQTGHEFSYYKRATVLRRIGRRMQVNGLETLTDYLAYMRQHPGEAGALLKDLLISVTNFFRDREAFQALEEQLPRLFADKKPDDTVRVWVTACATGEEAYSLAMMLSDYAATLPAPPSIQVFATDISEDAIVDARLGVYPETIVADVNEERLRRHFIREHGRYRIKQSIRELVLFALHDLLKDSPFSRLDLVCSRNFLIYLNRVAQTRAMDIFHFALKSQGLLFLGSSEAVDDGSPLFTALNKRQRLYARRDAPFRSLPVPEGASTLATTLSVHLRDKEKHARTPASPLLPRPLQLAASPAFTPDMPWSELHFGLMQQFSPPSVLIDAHHDIVHLSAHATQFLQFTGGLATVNLLKVVHPRLRIELRTALFRAGQTRDTSGTSDLPFEVEGRQTLVELRVLPADQTAPGHLLVVFLLKESPNAATDVPVQSSTPTPAVLQMEKELVQVKDELRSTIEQFAASTEELQASNEELQAMNEELRSATEEMETGREELQSINEELTTVNQEAKGKVEEISRANSDLQNFIASTDIATIFLDRDLCIQRYTPSAIELFHLIPTDVGRPLSDLANRLTYPGIIADARHVLAKLGSVEKEVQTDKDHRYLARILPYRTAEDHIAGVVLTFIDITLRKNAENRTRERDLFISTVAESARALIAVFDVQDHKAVYVNQYVRELFGYKVDEWMALPWDRLKALVHPDDKAGLRTFLTTCQEAARGHRVTHQFRGLSRDGAPRWLRVVGTPFGGQSPSHGAAQVLCVVDDITDQKTATEALAESRQEMVEVVQVNAQAKMEMEAAGRAKDHFMAVLSHELRTPLTPVLMTLPMLMELPDLTEEMQEGLEMIQRNVEIEVRFIDQLLDFIRISKGKVEFTAAVFDAHEAIRHAVQVSRHDFTDKGQRLEVDLKAERHHVLGDFYRIQQAVWNILKNAAKFTPPSKTIHVSSRCERDRIVVEIADEGQGIIPENLVRIFNAFEQGGAPATKNLGGLGLGLAIARSSVEAASGSLYAKSSGLGKGSIFVMELPLALPPAPGAAEATSVKPQSH